MNSLWNYSLTVGSFAFVLWTSGTYDKYPELTLPLLILFIAATSRDIPHTDWSARLSKLKRYRKTAEKYQDFDAVSMIDVATTRMTEEVMPVTVFELKKALGKLEPVKSDWEIYDRIKELKKSKSTS